ncbi:MAG: hypothetical protein GXO17_06880 [Thermodesulfobacteria bacterium]|nr:hypothetical protein [Thermodesulfobacteriota bacterium]
MPLRGDFELGSGIAFHQRVRVERRVFLIVALISLAGFLYCGAEAVLSFFGRTLCHAETCAIVESFSRLSRQEMAALAALFFLFQTIGAFSLWWAGGPFLRPLIFTSAMALGAEAVFLGRQFVDYQLHCPFCLTVAAFVVSSSALVLLSCKRLAVFGAVAGMVLALLLTPLSIEPLSRAAVKHIHRGSPTESFILIYAEDCPHCHEVLSFCEKMEDIDLLLCPKEKAFAFLRMLDIPGVPVMVVNKNGEKRVLVGSGLILSYLKEGEKPKAPSLDEFLSPSGICEENKKCEPLEGDEYF